VTAIVGARRSALGRGCVRTRLWRRSGKSAQGFEIYWDQVRAGYRGDWESGGRNDLDFLVIEKAIELAEQQMNIGFETVRGAFIEFGPLYKNSWLYEGAHVAIAVRRLHRTSLPIPHAGGVFPATAFLFNLISRLQFSGTVPMIDIQADAHWLAN
jgi:hypothetical protein